MGPRRWSFWASWGVIALTLVLYAYAVWAAIGNVLLLPQFAGSLGLGISATGWFWLSFQVALPLLIALAALILGRRRSLPTRALLLVAGVTLVSVISIDIAHSIPQSSFFA